MALTFCILRECSGSVVECLTQDQGVAGLSLTGVTVLLSFSKTHLSWLSTGSTQKTCPCLTERLLMGGKESNQNLLYSGGFSHMYWYNKYGTAHCVV